MRGCRCMLKCDSYGWRSVSISDDGFLTNVTPRSCGPRRDRQPRLQVFVDVRVVLPAGRRLDRERLNVLAVDQHLEVVRLVQALDHLVAVTGEANLDVVVAVARERVADQRAPARAQRQAFDVLLLRNVGLDANRVAARRPQRGADGEAADLLRGRYVAVEQGRGEVGERDVVEPVTGLVRREERRRVDV